MSAPPFLFGIRVKLVLIALLLLCIPLIGLRFVRDMERYLREGHQEVLLSAAKLLSASLSDRPQLFRMNDELPDAERESGSVERERLLALFESADPGALSSLGATYQPSADIEKILAVVSKSASRIWVVDKASRVRGFSGSLAAATTPSSIPAAPPDFPVARQLLDWLVSSGSTSPVSAADEKTLVMAQVERALSGEPTLRQRQTGPRGGTVISVAQPIWQGEDIVGAVVLEETSANVQAIKRTALESLLIANGIVLLAGFVALLGFAWWLASRVRALQRDANAMIDAQGKIRSSSTQVIRGVDNRDEIGDLARTLELALERLRRYNRYLEQMSARLSHELRTPLAVVRSSVDNLRQAGVPADSIAYLERADSGLARLSTLVTRLSEASQLERMLEGADREGVELDKLVESCALSYCAAYAPRRFEFSVDAPGNFRIDAVADALVQLLDKLAQNANDFAVEGTPIRFRVGEAGRFLVIAIENEGPVIDPDTAETLFSSMVTRRPEGTGHQGHLGLGLYVARIIVDFHGGKIRASNLQGGRGVRIEVHLPRN